MGYCTVYLNCCCLEFLFKLVSANLVYTLNWCHFRFSFAVNISTSFVSVSKVTLFQTESMKPNSSLRTITNTSTNPVLRLKHCYTVALNSNSLLCDPRNTCSTKLLTDILQTVEIYLDKTRFNHFFY